MTTFKEKVKSFLKKDACLFAIMAFGVTLLIEMISRHSVVSGISYMINRPFYFFYDMLIVFITMCIALPFKRRHFVAALIAIVWTILGFVNGMVLLFRVTPFSAVDFRLIENALRICRLYIKPWMIVLAAAVIIGAVAGLVYLWRHAAKVEDKLPTRRSRIMHRLSQCCLAAVMLVVLYTSRDVAIMANVLPSTYDNIADAYENYGFVYCFATSCIESGIDKPSGYSESYMDEFMQKYDLSDEGSASGQTPNIIFVQLESFVDPNNFVGLEYSENPIPNATYLRENFSSGLVKVPSIGAGTANTEFEVLCGLNLEDFGTGEYPYKTVVRKNSAESFATNLKNVGYSAHAIHNNDATFYNRNAVFANLGFDTYTPIESMTGYDKNELGWADDTILTRYITESLDSTEGQDFVFAITVQSHGAYPDESEQEMPIAVIGDSHLNNAHTLYYVNEISKVDAWIGELINTLSQREEPTVVVFYGDHYPTLDIESDDVTGGTLDQTQWFSWANFDMETTHADVNSYELQAYWLNKLGITASGKVAQYTQKYSSDPDYLEGLSVLGYDTLYGEQYVYGGQAPYVKNTLTYGCHEVSMDSIVPTSEDEYLVTGKGFTEYTKVMLNGDPVETVFVSENTLLVQEKLNLDEEDELGVATVTVKGRKLGAITYYTGPIPQDITE